MKISTVLVIVLVLIFYLILPLILWLTLDKNKYGKIVVRIFLISFLIILFFAVTSVVNINKSYVEIIINFKNNWCSKAINFSLKSINKIDFLINITMLLPIGLAIVYCNKNNIGILFLKLFIFGIIIGLSIETIQYILPVFRSVQLSDILLNTLSVIIGGCVGFAYERLYKKFKK